LRVTASSLVAEIIERLEGEPAERGRPRLPVADVVGTLRFFLREGVQWRELPASDGRASGSTLRRRLREWRDTAVLARVHAVLLRMRSRNRRPGVGRDRRQLQRPGQARRRVDRAEPRGKRGTKYHIVVASDGRPLGAVASAANVHDTKMFPELLRLALVVGARIARLLADAGYDSADNRWLCLREGIQPLIRKIGSGHGSGLGVVRSVVENANAWLLNNKRLDRRHDRSAGIIQSLLTTACIFVIANRLADL
jgi:transposase